MKEERTGMEELRILVSNFNSNSETFNDRYTAEELLQIQRMWWASEWDFLPDQWQPWQVKDALKGLPPKWDDNEKPLHYKKKKKKRTPS